MSFETIRNATFVRHATSRKLIIVDAIGTNRQHIIGHYSIGNGERVRFELAELVDVYPSDSQK